MLDTARHCCLAWLTGASAILGAVMAGCASENQDGERPAQARPAVERVEAPTARVNLAESSAGAQNGRDLFVSLGCMGCHMVNGKGGQAGTDLSDEANKGRSRQWLQTKIRNPKADNPQSVMPANPTLSDEQVNSLVDYLQSLTAKGAQEGQKAAAPQSRASQPQQTATPASLVTAGGEEWSRRCGQCHNLRPPSEYDDAQWAVAMYHMRVRVPLTGQQQRSILAFLQASN